MLGLTQTIRRTFTWAVRLMFSRIERLGAPPDSAVPMRCASGDTVASHAPVQVSITARVKRAGALVSAS